MNYRIGIRTQMSLECLVQFANIEAIKQAGNLMGRKVQWKNGKTMLMGKIVGFHGRNGVVRVRFKKGVPGQAIGAKVELISKPLTAK